MTSDGTEINYLCCNNLGEHQSKMKNMCEKEKVMLNYTTLQMPQLNGFIKRIFTVIKEGKLDMLLKAKLKTNTRK